ncbi:SIMPL domain-containing protein [Kitasatospora sp. NPDC091257]|uniref:SIMPL domain-containing protein n=1 Tax=Kitasatospora sp. NPDC091257 TaxID=3364084 RepID=UPI0038166EE0
MADKVTVAGRGTAEAVADLVVIRGADTARAKTATETVSAAHAVGEKLRTALREQRVADRAIEIVSQPPQNDCDSTGATVSHHAEESVSVTVRQAGGVTEEVERIVKIIESVDERFLVRDVGFDVADRASLRAEAHRAALADARAQAVQYAKPAGRELGSLASSVDGDETSENSSGKIEMSVTVNVVYNLR